MYLLKNKEANDKRDEEDTRYIEEVKERII